MMSTCCVFLLHPSAIHTIIIRIRAPAAIVFDDGFPPAAIVFDDGFPPAAIQAEALIVFKDMFVSDINDYRTENIVHPSQNVSTYGTKFAFLLKDNNNKTCHRICTTFIVILLVTDEQLTVYTTELVLCMIIFAENIP